MDKKLTPTTPVASTKPRFAGVHLTLVAPSRQWMTETGEIDYALHQKAQASLQELGFSVTTWGGVYLEDRRFAGTDAERAADWMAALTTPHACDLVMALRGGWGAARILPLLDWERLSSVIAIDEAARDSWLPVPLMGFSDFTAMNLALWSKTGRLTWQGPTLRDLIEPDELTLAGLEMALGRRPWKVAWEGATVYGGRDAFTLEGPIWGGNLTVLTSLIGTPYFPSVQQTAGGMLFIEEVGEAAYRLDRMLMQLSLSGALDGTRAILVGHCSGADRAYGWAGDFSLKDVLADTAARTGIPVITGLPFGHVHAKASLPVGCSVRLRYEDGTVSLSCVAAPSMPSGR